MSPCPSDKIPRFPEPNRDPKTESGLVEIEKRAHRKLKTKLRSVSLGLVIPSSKASGNRCVDVASWRLDTYIQIHLHVLVGVCAEYARREAEPRNNLIPSTGGGMLRAAISSVSDERTSCRLARAVPFEFWWSNKIGNDYRATSVEHSASLQVSAAPVPYAWVRGRTPSSLV